MGGQPVQRLILDAGALIAFEKGSSSARALVLTARRLRASMIVPAGALAQVWRNGARQARLAALINAADVNVEPLDTGRAKAAGVLCGLRGTSDVVDASVVLAARVVGGFIATSDPDDLRRLDPSLSIVAI